jgi:long-subunit fatty acid transport protein
MKKTGVAVAALFACTLAVAQDTHYWTHQFGTRSALLGGAVVGGTRDNSMIYYNPAAVAFIDSNSFSINANVYQVENTQIKNILTEQEAFKSFQLTSVPLLTSGQFKVKTPRLRLSYGIFSPVAFQFRGQARIEGAYAVVPDGESPGQETFVGDENLFTRLRELTVALGISYKLSEWWSVGLTNLIDVRSHHFNRALFSRYYLNDSDATGVSTSFTQSFNYYNVRYMPKFGIAFRGKPWSWGATFTAPGIRMLGTGAVGVDILASNVKDGGAGRSNVVANGRQTKLKSYFKSPYSVAMGVHFQQGKTGISFSTQYFGKQEIYNIIKADKAPFVRPASVNNLINSAEMLSVKTAARPVLNLALGVEQQLSEHLSLNASIRNNQSYYDAQLLNQDGIKPDISTWDIYHLTGGVTMLKERSSMSLGLTFGFGQDKNRSEQFLPQPSESAFFRNPVTVTQATYKSLGILVGYNYFFKKG